MPISFAQEAQIGELGGMKHKNRYQCYVDEPCSF